MPRKLRWIEAGGSRRDINQDDPLYVPDENAQNQPTMPTTSQAITQGTSLGISVRWNGIDVTGAHAGEVMVGQRIGLAVHTNLAPEVQYMWTVNGDRIGNYEISTEKGEVTPLGPVDRASIAYYWLTAGEDVGVEITVSSGGKTISRKSTFDILRPTATIEATISSSGSQVHVIREKIIDGTSLGEEVALGSIDGGHGVTLEANVATPDGGEGQFALLQVTNSFRLFLVENPPMLVALESGPRWVLDTADDPEAPLYSVPQNIDANSSASINASDSPGQGLSESYERVTINESFRTYLMYRPSGELSIWVALERLDWDHSVEVAKNGQGDSAIVESAAWASPWSNDAFAFPLEDRGQPEWEARMQDIEPRVIAGPF